MIHDADDGEYHDPILGSAWNDGCAACLAARNSTFAQLRQIVGGLGPYDTDAFVARLQAIAQEHLGAAQVIVWVVLWVLCVAVVLAFFMGASERR